MGDYQRKRSTVACDVCRRRRTKCDGERPKCGFCQAHDAHCAYQAVPEPPPSRLEIDIAGMRERLDHIIDLLASDQRSSDTRSWPRPAAEARYGSDDADFPVMILQRRTMMLVLGLDQNTGAWLSNMERSTRLSSNQHQAGLSRMMLLLQPHGVSSALQAFSERVHVWLPILASDFYDSFSQCISGQCPTPSDTCLAMLVMALGSFAAVDSITIALDERPDAVFFAEAAALLPDVLLDFSVQSLQCLILFTVYHMCLIRPCQAHDHVIMASARAQNMLKTRFYGADTKDTEALRRAYWAILLIESELSTQLDLPRSGIWQLEEEIPLPSADWTWYFPPTVKDATPSSSTQIFGTGLDVTPAYFLAEIAMRRMLRRCTTSVSKSAEGGVRYASVIAKELELQLDEWYEYLPPPLIFHKQPTRMNQIAALAPAHFLQTQYFACKATIYWPAVYQAIKLGSADQELLPYCAEFFYAYVSFVLAAIRSLRTCILNTWTLAASIFIITMAAIKATDTDELEEALNPRVFHCFSLASEAFVGLTPYSPSLAALADIMQERVERVRSRSAQSQTASMGIQWISC